MKLKQVIALADEIKPNAFSNAVKTAWINEVEGLVETEIWLRAPDDITEYEYPAEGEPDTELLVKPPHDKIYISYLIAMIDFANGEYDRYDNTVAMFNTRFAEYERWFSSRFCPADGSEGVPMYYLSGYGLALKHGFVGTEEEWLASLKGDKGEKGEKGDTGNKGDKGDTGSKGDRGSKGDKGDNGSDGESAYDIAKKNGFEGTEKEWSDSLLYASTEVNKLKTSKADRITEKSPSGKSVVLTDNCVFTFDTCASLSVSAGSTMKKTTAACELIFTSGSTVTTFSSDEIRYKGSDCSGGTFTPTKNNRYSIMYGYNGTSVYGLVLGFEVSA